MEIIAIEFEIPALIGDFFKNDIPGVIRIDTQKKQSLLIQCLATLEEQNREDNELLNSCSDSE